MSTTERYSKEPWRHVFVDGGWDGVAEPGGAVICKLVLNEPANARRIVAAVNACAGIPTEALEGGVVSELLDALRSARHAIGDHHASADCYSTGPVTGNFVIDHLACPACSFIARYDVVMWKAEGRDHG
jgi:hypothetical protein